jgi:excisionase family DNA binding protein
MIKQEYYSTKDAAQYLGIEQALLRKYSREKKIKSYRIGGKKLYFKLSELDEWVALHKLEG